MVQFFALESDRFWTEGTEQEKRGQIEVNWCEREEDTVGKCAQAEAEAVS